MVDDGGTPAVIEARPFLRGISYGEGPRWHDGRLWFTDGLAGRVYSAGASGDLTVEAEIPRASGLGWLSDGTLVVSTLFDTKVHYVGPTGAVLNTVDLGEIGWSTNDLVVTPDDRIYVDIYRGVPGGGDDGIVVLDATGAARIVATGLTTPNGLALLPDGTTFVASETRGSRILAFPVEPDGSLGIATVFADLGSHRHPDGLCVDAEAGVWVGCYDTREFLRVVAGGAVTHRIPVEGGWAVAPVLGGPDGRTLYLLVDNTTHDRLVAGDSTGWILQARVDVPACGSP